MTQAAFGGTAFNSTVHLWLELGLGRVPLRQAGADFVIASDPVDLPPATVASLVVSIDGDEHHRKVLLPEGMSAQSRRTPVLSCEEDGLPF